ncbi:MAG: trypsin-like serine protease [Myxococcota bacterium]
MRRTTMMAGLVATVLVAGCSEGNSLRPLGLTNERAGGLRVTTADVYSTVFSLARLDTISVEASICSATLVAPTVLVTAAHCVTIERGDGEYKIQDVDDFYLENGISVEELGGDLAVDAIEVHPEYEPGTAFFDIALVYLDQDATPLTGGRLMRVARSIDEGHVGLARGANIVGHGGNDYPDFYYDAVDAPEKGARLHVAHELSKFGCNADDPACDYGNLALSYDNSPEAGFCGSAGGGPVLLFRDAQGDPAAMPWQYLEADSPVPPGGSVVLGGVVSRVVEPEDCVGEGIATRLDSAIGFLDDVLPEDPAPRRSLPLPWE